MSSKPISLHLKSYWINLITGFHNIQNELLMLSWNNFGWLAFVGFTTTPCSVHLWIICSPCVIHWSPKPHKTTQINSILSGTKAPRHGVNRSFSNLFSWKTFMLFLKLGSGSCLVSLHFNMMRLMCFKGYQLPGFLFII